jgi:hypothetical protein
MEMPARGADDGHYTYLANQPQIFRVVFVRKSGKSALSLTISQFRNPPLADKSLWFPDVVRLGLPA